MDGLIVDEFHVNHSCLICSRSYIDIQHFDVKRGTTDSISRMIIGCDIEMHNQFRHLIRALCELVVHDIGKHSAQYMYMLCKTMQNALGTTLAITSTH